MPVDRYRARRLSDKILVVFHHACDLEDHEVADQMLRVLEAVMMRRAIERNDRRARDREGLVAAHQRLWELRHREMP